MIELNNPQLANDLEELAELYGIDSDELLTEIVRSGLIAWKIKYIEIEIKELRENGRKINKKIFRNTPYYK
jgi:diphthamide synthase (EF-2-diphthine--ammonia ligase)